jgi:hypothetical protein
MGEAGGGRRRLEASPAETAAELDWERLTSVEAREPKIDTAKRDCEFNCKLEEKNRSRLGSARHLQRDPEMVLKDR